MNRPEDNIYNKQQRSLYGNSVGTGNSGGNAWCDAPNGRHLVIT
jgi:hypothetical protein